MLVPDPQTGKPIHRKLRRRYEETGSARELTFSCCHRFKFLDRDRTRQWFIESLEQARSEGQFDIWAYVLMPEHVHLLVSPREDDASIGKFERRLKSPVAQKAIQWLEAHSPDWLRRVTVREGKTVRRRFWQPGGGYDRNIVESHTLNKAIDYIHANPVRRGLVESAVDWPWSSARWYAGMRPVPIEMDAILPRDDDSGGAR